MVVTEGLKTQESFQQDLETWLATGRRGSEGAGPPPGVEDPVDASAPPDGAHASRPAAPKRSEVGITHQASKSFPTRAGFHM